MKDKGAYRQSAKNAHTQGGEAAESSRNHKRDLERMVRNGEDARATLNVGKERQRKREQVKTLGFTRA